MDLLRYGNVMNEYDKSLLEKSADETARRYHVTVNGHAAQTDRPSYAEGETVRIRIPVVMDARMEVSCDNAELRMLDTEGWELVYEIKMPAADVDVRVSVTSDMTCMSVPDSGKISESSSLNKAEEGIVCPECGARFEKDLPKYCPECGSRLR